MNVFVVLLADPYATHFCGVYESREAANKFVELQDKDTFEGEEYIIDEVPVQKLIR
jgi:hypothetical protein